LESIWESVYSFVDGAEASDDITVVVVKWNSQEL
jgi:serine phosphatase RsbU (regulator of sigma subunit)